MLKVLEDYWLNGTGSKRFERNWWTNVPWSAAFISWVMKKAGAGKDFNYSASHSVYTSSAKENALKNNNNLFEAYPVTKVVPRVGDIVCKSRANSGATYDNIRPGMNTHCDIVTSVQPNSISMIGGNVDNSVSQKKVTTDPTGKITGQDFFAESALALNEKWRLYGMDRTNPPLAYAHINRSRFVRSLRSSSGLLL